VAQEHTIAEALVVVAAKVLRFCGSNLDATANIDKPPRELLSKRSRSLGRNVDRK
jgi:hypothetical protein